MVDNLKRSIRDKYKRRENQLRHAIEQYLIFAEKRLSASEAGKARNTSEIENICARCNELLAALPEVKGYKLDPSIDIEKLLGENDIDEILKAGDEWFNSLTPEEVKEILEYAKSKDS